MTEDNWNYGNILGFCGASVQKLERMTLDVDDGVLLSQLEAAKIALRAAYQQLRKAQKLQH